MNLPKGLITGKTARLPTDWKKQPTTIHGVARSALEEGFLRLWQTLFPDLSEPVLEYRFCPSRKWRLDFAWPDVMLAVEIDGGAFGGGRHQRREGFSRDAEKHRALIYWRVLRYTGDDLKRQPVQCVEQVAKVLVELKAAQAAGGK